jgi:hypothetical protein
MKSLFVTFYSDDVNSNYYKSSFHNLEKTFKKFNLELYGEQIPYNKEYKNMCLFKPSFILKCLNDFNKNIIWIDADTTLKNIPVEFEDNIHDIIESHNYGAVVNGENSWYNHPQYRPVAYDFCSGLTADNIRKLNGYDERFSEGCSYGDDYLISRVRMLGLNIEIPVDPFVVHQWHYNIAGNPDHQALCKRNSELLIKLNAENNYRAVHLITPDL